MGGRKEDKDPEKDKEKADPVGKSRSPPRGAAAPPGTLALVSTGSKDEPPPSQPSQSLKRAKEDDKEGGWVQYSPEEWKAWRKEQQDRWDRWEDAHQVQKNYNKDLEHKVNVLRGEQEKMMESIRDHEEGLLAVGEMASRGDQDRKEKDVELATRQIRICNWNGEDERERRVTCTRWLEINEMEHERVVTLHKKGTSIPLHFSLLTMHSKVERDEALRKLQGESPMWGLRGSRLYSSKNIAKFQREAGEWLRFLMTAMTNTHPDLRFDKPHWEFEALECDGQWLAAVIPDHTTTRRKILAYNRSLVSGEEFHTACTGLWRAWGGYCERWKDVRPQYTSEANSSTVNPSTQFQEVSSASARSHYLQDWWEFLTAPLTQEQVSLLNAAKKEKEQRGEARGMRRYPKSAAKKKDADVDDDDDEDEEMDANKKKSSAAAVQHAKSALKGGGPHVGPPNPFAKHKGPPRVVGVDDTGPLKSSFDAWQPAKQDLRPEGGWGGRGEWSSSWNSGGDGEWQRPNRGGSSSGQAEAWDADSGGGHQNAYSNVSPDYPNQGGKIGYKGYDVRYKSPGDIKGGDKGRGSGKGKSGSKKGRGKFKGGKGW